MSWIVTLHLYESLSSHAAHFCVALTKHILCLHLRHESAVARNVEPCVSIWNQVKLVHVGLWVQVPREMTSVAQSWVFRPRGVFLTPFWRWASLWRREPLLGLLKQWIEPFPGILARPVAIEDT